MRAEVGLGRLGLMRLGLGILGLRQARVRVLRWHGSHSAVVNENINRVTARTRVTLSFKVRDCFRAILLCLILKGF